jgi:hypothetical protein
MRAAISFCLLALALTSSVNATEPSQLELRIGKVTGIVEVGEEGLRSKLHVVVRNRSNKPARIFDEWNSWGYHQLTFTAEFKNGRSIELKRRGGQIWHANAPDVIELEPGEMYVYEVRLDSVADSLPLGGDPTNAWGPIRIRRGDSLVVTLRAHYALGDVEHPFDLAQFAESDRGATVSSPPVRIGLRGAPDVSDGEYIYQLPPK